jgi:hypothetical protein
MRAWAVVLGELRRWTAPLRALLDPGRAGQLRGDERVLPSFEYRRLERWVPSATNGWDTANVAARLEAGTRGGHYLEHLPFGPTISDHPAARELLALLGRTSLERAVLLDVGSGNGVLRELLGAAGWLPRWSYWGADVNRASVESCRRRYPEARFEVVGGDGRLPFPDQSADVVLASGVLECVEHPGALLAELRRVSRAWVALCRVGVRPGGAPALYRQTVRHAWGLEQHCFHVFTRIDLREKIAAARLEIVSEELSPSSGEWLAPDDPEPLPHYTYLLRRG